jgi:flavin reductase (DIM6/NTAB) family NADH-FMN oxidoreductase RutF
VTALALRLGSDHEDARRRVIWMVPTILAVLGTTDGRGSGHLMNISWVTPAADGPSRLVASLESSSESAVLLGDEGPYALSLLGREQREWGRVFAKPATDWRRTDGREFVRDAEVSRSAEGAPFLVDAVAVLAGRAERLADLGSHQLYLLTVIEVGAVPEALEGPASARPVPTLGIHDTRMNYGR